MERDQLLLGLVAKAKQGDGEAFEKIIDILDKDIKKVANKFFIAGSDQQDVLQECKIGIWKAVKDFDENGGMSFKNFSVSLCCKRHLITAMSHANTFKFKHHNESVSLQSVPSSQVDDITLTYADIIQDPSPSLLESYIEKEEFDENLELVKDKLTKLEFSIFSQYAYNTSYKEIAKTLDVKAKTVDNALMRIRKKSQESYQSYLIAQENYGIHTNCFVSTTFVTFEREIYVGFATSSLLESNF